MATHPQIKAFQFPITVQIPAERLWHLVVSAFEGGSNYWIRVVVEDRRDSNPERPARVASELPFLGGSIVIELNEETSEYRPDATDVHRSRRDARILDDTAIAAGLGLLAAAPRYRHHFCDILNDHCDNDTADVFLQFCIFGECVYG